MNTTLPAPDPAAQALHDALDRAQQKALDARAIESGARLEAEKWEAVAEQVRQTIGLSNRDARNFHKPTAPNTPKNGRVSWKPIIEEILRRAEHADLGPTKRMFIELLKTACPAGARPECALAAAYGAIKTGIVKVVDDRVSLSAHA